MDITALASQPISEDSPAGFDAKYEPEYEALSGEIAKLSSVSSSSPISWQAVAENGEAILSRKSKDLAVASYVAVALIHLDGAQGFIDGANLLCGLCENFWEDAFPPKAKMRRRVNAYEWWHERALDVLRKEDQAPIPAQLSSAMTDAANNLDRTVSSLMEDASMLRDVTEAIRAIPLIPEEKTAPPEPPAPAQEETKAEERAPQEEAQQIAEPEKPAEATPPPPPAPVQPTYSAPPDIAAALSAFVDASRAYASMLRAEEPMNPLAWQLPRLALWGKIAALPPDDGSGRTMVPPPDSQRIEAAERLFAGKNWLKAACAADDLFLSYPLYIDLQRIADESLANLGAPFASARAALRAETKAFTTRLPGLTSLSYDDGTPFVSSETRAWLDDLANEGGAENAARSGAGGAADSAIAKAREILAEGDAAGALKKLEEAQGLSATANALLRAEAIRMLCAQREIKTAAALARALASDIERDKIAALEPDIAAEALTSAARALDIAGDTQSAEEIREKIAAIKPSAVLGWN